MQRFTRARNAMRRYPSMATFMSYGEPVHHLEAALVEQDGGKRDTLLLDVAQRVASNGNPTDAVRAIVSAFLVTPRDDGISDQPECPAEDPMVTATGQGDPKEARDLAKTQAEQTKRNQDDKRDVEDLKAAATVLGLAVRMNGTLVLVVQSAATTLRGLAQRTKDDTVRVTLNSAADDLDNATAAPGTMATDQTPDDKADAQLAASMARNAGEAPAVRTFCKEWRQIGTSLSRERYAQVNLDRLRTDQAGA